MTILSLCDADEAEGSGGTYTPPPAVILQPLPSPAAAPAPAAAPPAVTPPPPVAPTPAPEPVLANAPKPTKYRHDWLQVLPHELKHHTQQAAVGRSGCAVSASVKLFKARRLLLCGEMSHRSIDRSLHMHRGKSDSSTYSVLFESIAARTALIRSHAAPFPIPCSCYSQQHCTQWLQMRDWVEISIFAKKLTAERLTVNIEPRHLQVVIRDEQVSLQGPPHPDAHLNPPAQQIQWAHSCSPSLPRSSRLSEMTSCAHDGAKLRNVQQLQSNTGACAQKFAISLTFPFVVTVMTWLIGSRESVALRHGK